MPYWSSGCGRLELEITEEQAAQCSHPGPCDSDVQWLSCQPEIARQLNALDPALLREELDGYGAWDDVELGDHQQNLLRVLWLACSDISEEVTA